MTKQKAATWIQEWINKNPKAPQIVMRTNGLRKCLYCNEVKPLSEYKYKEKDSKNCESCYHKYIKNRKFQSDKDFQYLLIGEGDWYSCYF